jgi:hypothetical protein
MKRLMGKTKVEDALERLDMLTQEENLMVVARTFEATQHVLTIDDHVETVMDDLRRSSLLDIIINRCG